MRLEVHRFDWPFRSTFRIAYRVQTHAETVLVALHDGGLVGRGEALGVSYHDETVDGIMAQLDAIRPVLADGITRQDVQVLLPPGGARNALDCALWDLEAKRERRRAWELAGIGAVRPLTTAFTLGVDSPAAMARAAAEARQYPLLKLKLAGGEDIDRVAAVRAARPDAEIIVDANQAWDIAGLHAFTPRLAELGVTLIEQPLPAGADDALADYDSPVPLCADESCQTAASLPGLVGKYRYVNIKLDKCGGLTEGLALARAARAAGFELMVGCMAGSSLSMAPAFVVGQLCSVVDLDGPLLAAADVPNAIRYDGGLMHPPEADLWG